MTAPSLSAALEAALRRYGAALADVVFVDIAGDEDRRELFSELAERVLRDGAAAGARQILAAGLPVDPEAVADVIGRAFRHRLGELVLAPERIGEGAHELS